MKRTPPRIVLVETIIGESSAAFCNPHCITVAATLNPAQTAT